MNKTSRGTTLRDLHLMTQRGMHLSYYASIHLPTVINAFKEKHQALWKHITEVIIMIEITIVQHILLPGSAVNALYNLFKPHRHYYPTFQLKKLKHKEIKHLSQGFAAREQSLDTWHESSHEIPNLPTEDENYWLYIQAVLLLWSKLICIDFRVGKEYVLKS